MRFGLRSPAYDCNTCTARDKRNCGNQIGYRQTLWLKEEWKDLPTDIRHVEKWDDLKLLECPLSVITAQSWEILRIVNSTINGEGDITVLPYEGAFLDQPQWYRQAVEIVRRERAEHRRREIDKRGK